MLCVKKALRTGGAPFRDLVIGQEIRLPSNAPFSDNPGEVNMKNRSTLESFMTASVLNQDEP
jgi:hypothetical protein